MTRSACCLIGLLPLLATASEGINVGDSYVSSSNPTNNFGSAGNLLIGGNNRAFVQFDLSRLPAGTTADQVGSAYVLVWVNRVQTSGAVDVSQVTSAWAEGTVTFNNAPTVAGVEATAPV